MSYEIRTFSEEYIEKQAEIGQKAYENWTGAAQSDASRLKAAYTSENPSFDPETKFYAFKGEEMVGFATATIQPKEDDKPLIARLEFPLVLPEYEDARDELLKAALEGLKNKGVEKVQSRAGPNWGYTLGFVKKYEYKLTNQLSKFAEFQVDSIDVDSLGSFEKVSAFDRENDLEAMLDTFVQFYNLEDENQIKGLKQQIIDLPTIVSLVAENVIKEGEKIVGRQLLYTREGDDFVTMGTFVVTAENKDEVEQQLLAASIDSIKKSEFSKCKIQLFGNLEENEKKYRKLGLNFKDDLGMYEKSI